MSIEGMIVRFRGLTKAQMIEKYNSKNCAPMWTPSESLDARNAMKMLLKDEVPNEIIKKPDPLDEIKAMPDNDPIEVEEIKSEDELLQDEIKKEEPKEPEKEIELPEEKFTMKRKSTRKKK